MGKIRIGVSGWSYQDWRGDSARISRFRRRHVGREYRAESVIVWDHGRAASSEDGQRITLIDRLKRNHVAVWLDGEKIRGRYSLVRTG